MADDLVGERIVAGNFVVAPDSRRLTKALTKYRLRSNVKAAHPAWLAQVKWLVVQVCIGNERMQIKQRH